jgi:hypothetical protein
VQVVEAELQRIPAHIARRYNQQLWSIVYMPQVTPFLCACAAGCGGYTGFPQHAALPPCLCACVEPKAHRHM